MKVALSQIGLILFAWLLFLTPSRIAGGEEAARYVRVGDQEWQILAVIDGDTIRVRAANLPTPLDHMLIRIRGIDTPEIGSKAKCLHEQEEAEKARRFTEQFLLQGNIQIEDLKWDKYGGRVLADLWVAGKSLSEHLIKAQLGRPYDGGKRRPWCA